MPNDAFSSALSVEEAQGRVLDWAISLESEFVPLQQSLGRVLAQPIAAPFDSPLFDNSAMDGFAVRAADLLVPGAKLRVVGESAAGKIPNGKISAGQTMRIFTGAPLPAGADAVVMVEQTDRNGDLITFHHAVQVGEHVRKRGTEVRSGDVVLAAGQKLGPVEIGILAFCQQATLAVVRCPRVAILVTGNEITELGKPLRPGAIPDTNSYVLKALTEQAGAKIELVQIVPDDPEELQTAIAAASGADVIISSGGVSVGEHDHVRNVLASMGAELGFWRVQMKPGKPLLLARLHRSIYFGLPGNPVSAWVTFLLFVRPFLRRLQNLPPFDLEPVNAILNSPLSHAGDRRHYARVRLGCRDDIWYADPCARQGSGDLISLAGVSGLLPIDAPKAAGQIVKVLKVP